MCLRLYIVEICSSKILIKVTNPFEKSTRYLKHFEEGLTLLEYLPTDRSIKFMSKLNWKELIPYIEKIYGSDYAEILIKRLKEN